MRARSRERDSDGGVPHRLLSAGLIVALTILSLIGLSGKFQAYNSQGLLTGPFSALLLLTAAVLALLLLVLVDWKVWTPQRREKSIAIARWLAKDVLGGTDAQTPALQMWSTLSGKFDGYEVSLARVRTFRLGAVRWSLLVPGPANFPQLTVLRPLVSPNSSAQLADKYSTGDAEFDQKYLWQSAQPDEALVILQNERARKSLKRLATFFAQRGNVFAGDFGVKIGGGAITLLQAPAPWLRPGTFNAGEVLLILHDLTTLADVLTQRERPPREPAAQESADSGGSPWLALGCAALIGVVLWLGMTALLAHWGGMSAAMIGFFIPPLMLAFVFMTVSAGGSGREPEIDDAIRNEAANVLRERPELGKLAKAVEG